MIRAALFLTLNLGTTNSDRFPKNSIIQSLQSNNLFNGSSGSNSTFPKSYEIVSLDEDTISIDSNVAALNLQADSDDNNFCTAHTLGISICNGNLGIKRSEMPQLEDPKVLDAYIKAQNDKLVLTTFESIPATSLTPIQNEMNLTKIRRIVSSFLKKEFDPCSSQIIAAFSAQENKTFVIDGHHRFAACYLLNRYIDAIIIHHSPLEILNELRYFPGVTFQGINEFSNIPSKPPLLISDTKVLAHFEDQASIEDCLSKDEEIASSV